MKTGAMFSGLLNDEYRSFYHADPFITFKTMYEDGRCVVFAVSTVSTGEYDRLYVDFYDLKSTYRQRRQTAPDALISASLLICPDNVQVDDQLLLLVTCTEKDRDQRVVVRDGEDEAALKKLVEKSRER